MQVCGVVRDAGGHSLAGARVVALGAAQEAIARAVTDATGRFRLSGEGIVMLEATGPDWDGPAAQITTLPRLWRVPGCPRPAEVETVLTLRRARPVALRAFANGELLSDPTPATRNQIARCWFLDMAGKVAPGAFRWHTADGGPWIFLPPGQRTHLLVLWTALGFGSLVCHADAGGHGLLVGEGMATGGIQEAEDGSQELWLNEDLAHTACVRLQKVWSQARAEGYRLSDSATEDRNIALAEWRAMEAIPLPACNQAERLSARALRAAHADAALSAALWAMEKLVLEKAEQDIVRHRRLSRAIQVRRADGQPTGNARLRYRQTEHDFRFGVFVNPTHHPVSREPFNGRLWTAIKEIGINQVPVSMCWSRHEPERGQRRDAERDAIYPCAGLHQAGFRLKAHVTVWLWHGRYPEQWHAFIPAWLYHLDPAGVQRAAYEHQRALAAYNCDHVAGFQSINEPMLSHTNGPNLTLDQTVELVRQSSRGIRDGGGRGPIEVNNCCVFGESINADIREQGYERMPCEFFEDLEKAGVDYDEVGIQLYYGGYMYGRMFTGGFPVRHLLDLSEVIDRFSRFGKPVNVSEVSVPSSPPPPDGPYVGEWHGPWTPERQAAWIKAFYTLCYSKKQVQEITWWNATDEEAFIRSGGLMTADYQPKPAYFAMRDLIQGLKAAGHAQADAAGVVLVDGPAGLYEIQVELDGRTYGPYTVHLADEKVEITVTGCGV